MSSYSYPCSWRVLTRPSSHQCTRLARARVGRDHNPSAPRRSLHPRRPARLMLEAQVHVTTQGQWPCKHRHTQALANASVYPVFKSTALRRPSVLRPQAPADIRAPYRPSSCPVSTCTTTATDLHPSARPYPLRPSAAHRDYSLIHSLIPKVHLFFSSCLPSLLSSTYRTLLVNVIIPDLIHCVYYAVTY